MIDEIIEFNKVKDIWSSFAITSKAKEEIKERNIILDESTLRRELKDTSDAKDMIEKVGNPPLQDVSEILEILDIAEKGDCLTPYHLERVDSILIVLERLASYLKRGKQYQNSPDCRASAGRPPCDSCYGCCVRMMLTWISSPRPSAG